MERYARILELDDFKESELEILKSKKVLIIGVGGVGQHIATYLVTNGVINLTLVDYDNVELSNLNRQILLKEVDVGSPKLLVVSKELIKKNGEANIEVIHLKVNESNAKRLVEGFDLVIDATDNWEAKLNIGKACKDSHVPYLHVGVDGYAGQYALFINKSLDEIVSKDILNEPKNGVFGPMVGLISSLATMLAISYLRGNKDNIDTLFHYDNKKHKETVIKL